MLFLRKLFLMTMDYSCLDRQIDKFRELALAYKKTNSEVTRDRLLEIPTKE